MRGVDAEMFINILLGGRAHKLRVELTTTSPSLLRSKNK
jgi:hypothetical protein